MQTKSKLIKPKTIIENDCGCGCGNQCTHNKTDAVINELIDSI